MTNYRVRRTGHPYIMRNGISSAVSNSTFCSTNLSSLNLQRYQHWAPLHNEKWDIVGSIEFNLLLHKSIFTESTALSTNDVTKGNILHESVQKAGFHQRKYDQDLRNHSGLQTWAQNRAGPETRPHEIRTSVIAQTDTREQNTQRTCTGRG